jgi:solute carrier family 12 sodium/potassium/chloride transporter 2
MNGREGSVAPGDTGNEEKEIRKFGMFQGVFVPTLLTILGVILYLRLGWVVGNVGVIGAWAIIFIAFTITTATALSMSSLVSNIRIGPGGAYSIISRSMGLEIGGSIGVPLYLSLAFSVALYIFGFREGMQYIFPDLSPLLIDLAVFAVTFGIVVASTRIAFRIQYAILAIIIVSLVSVFAAGWGTGTGASLLQPPEGVSFWVVFAVFFPAATGIMAGANMSGELKNPRRAIPIGTLSAIGVTLVIYLVVAFWLSTVASSTQLQNDYTILIQDARWSQLVLAGLLAATFSSALNSMVGASRVLQAMGEHNILPGSGWLTKRSGTGIPRNAILLTGLIVFAALMLRTLNTIAPLITMFFLITYAMINVVILVEQSLGLVSFRPLLRIPRVVPLIGTVGAFFTMFIINPVFSLVAVVVVASFYYLLMYRHLKANSPYGDVRSSLFVAVAEWAARKSMKLPHSQERAWRPHLLIPVDDPPGLRGASEFIRDITYPRGSINIIGLTRRDQPGQLRDQIASLARDFEEDGVYTRWTMVESPRYGDGIVASIQALKSSFFQPNIVFLMLPAAGNNEEDTKEVLVRATESHMGIVLFAPHPQAALGHRRAINIWLEQGCIGWEPGMPLANCDLALLIAYKLRINWGGTLTLITPVENPDEVPGVERHLRSLIEETRITVDDLRVIPGDRENALAKSPPADLEIFSLARDPDLGEIHRLVDITEASCIFCRDSGEENALV